MGRLFLVSLVLLGVSCPRECGPRDYDPAAVRPFAPHPANADLVHVLASSAKGDSTFVVSMPEGKVLAPIDGPDRAGWAIAEGVAYYAVTNARGGAEIRRVDLRTGVHDRLVGDPGARLSPLGAPHVPLAATDDGRILVAASSNDATVRLARYDAKTGALLGERAWKLAGDSAAARLAPIDADRFVLSRLALREGRSFAQDLEIVDGDLATHAWLSSARGEVPAALPCDAALRPITAGWVTVCARSNDPEAAVLFLDPVFQAPRLVSVPLEGRPVTRPGAPEMPPARPVRGTPEETARPFILRETPLAWTVAAESIVLLTDRGRVVRVPRDGDSTVTRVPLNEHVASRLGPAAISTDRGFLTARVLAGDDRADVSLVAIDATSGRVTAGGLEGDRLLGLYASRDRVYAVVSRNDRPAVLAVLDRVSLAPLDPVASVGDDETSAYDVLTVVRSE